MPPAWPAASRAEGSTFHRWIELSAPPAVIRWRPSHVAARSDTSAGWAISPMLLLGLPSSGSCIRPITLSWVAYATKRGPASCPSSLSWLSSSMRVSGPPYVGPMTVRWIDLGPGATTRSLYWSLAVTTAGSAPCMAGGSQRQPVGTAVCSILEVLRSWMPPCTEERARSYSTRLRSSPVENRRAEPSEPSPNCSPVIGL
mmetsp:Transcript_32596/g.64926  ORF Transcript_32596/g.64926 Transcript_32596/m.64926 type:complete len:200 (-) Transcript_32596:1187-1786(-)